jgi:Tol biopolymer transport system component
MATGRRAFEGKSQASLISAIMSSQPQPVSQVAPTSPPQLDQIVRACLAKDPDDRIQTAHDVKLQLAWIAEAGSQISSAAVMAPARRPRRTERTAWLVAAVAVMVAAMAVAFSMKPKPESIPIHASIIPPPGVLYSLSTDKPLPLAISPDGTTIAFCGRNGEGPDLLWVRELASNQARPLAGTEGAEGPFFSPDGQSLAFYADSKLRRIDAAGGPVIDLVDDVDPRGGTWNRDDVILFTRASAGPIYRVSAGGGPVTAVTALDTTVGEATHRYAHFLPDGKHFLYLARRAGAGRGEEPLIIAQELGSAGRTTVVEVASNVMVASGHLLYVRGRILVAQPFDTKSLSVTGAAVPVVDDVRMDERFSRGVFAVSENGALVCMTGNEQTRTQLRWLDRDGKPLGDIGEPADYTYGGIPEISPDGRQAALPVANRDTGNSDVWVIDLDSGRRRKLTVDTWDHPGVCWLPDGKSVAVLTMRKSAGELTAMSTDGTTTRTLVKLTDFAWPLTAHGNTLIYTPDSRKAQDLLSVRIDGDGTSQDFIATPAYEHEAQFSPDGSLVAYRSTQTGRSEVFVATFPQPGARWQVSQNGGGEPRWRGDGRELFYVDRENYIVSVDVDHSAPGFQIGATRRLFQFHGAGADIRYDVSADGQRFLVTTPLDQDLTSPVTLITDWTRKLGQH